MTFSHVRESMLSCYDGGAEVGIQHLGLCEFYLGVSENRVLSHSRIRRIRIRAIKIRCP